ncbi:hypothetical protein H9Q69_005881 [Fusarium xylarioides]|uniref:Uncharacterized protein n=1 Tax=Fusarium xylarioides TaxID=221167 RepID=A0A9P7HWG2_9HYPO|nr:hypothetical protein H9Q70_004719 [Fusarium xylarioides]KAG5767728.1 hypothetical protein H9Q72_004539 [Fusarium xylarioides]KAG5795082.1 hypothetical protein H9Q69_005881 [Fusarium xylarioides]KAG5812092.1 hypothetical protein H9Q71_004527 [Fusarium xylarioides]KAG5825659.1 hypothetical protein H9Q74_004260 [Fusarium xylarioides]
MLAQGEWGDHVSHQQPKVTGQTLIQHSLTSTQQLRQSSRDVSYPWNFRSPAAANTNNCRFPASCSAVLQGHPLFPFRSSLGPRIVAQS